MLRFTGGSADEAGSGQFCCASQGGGSYCGTMCGAGHQECLAAAGANADTVVDAAKKQGLNTIHNSCILVEIRKQNPYL